ncbi:MAG: hypothetical protein U0270_44320 [Labilithrix sp.]
MRRVALAFVLATAGCAAVFGIPSDVEPQTLVDASTDASVEAAPSPPHDDVFVPAEGGSTGDCSTSMVFEAPEPLTELGGDADATLDARLSDDELTIYFAAKRVGDTSFHLNVATRTARDQAFRTATKVPGIADIGNDTSPSISADGMTLWWLHDGALQQAQRAKTAEPFGKPVAFKILDDKEQEVSISTPFVRAERPEEVWFASGKTGVTEPFDVFVGKVTQPVLVRGAKVGAVNDEGKNDQNPVISADGLTLYFAKVREPDATNRRFFDIYMAERANPTGAFGAPKKLDALAGAGPIDTLPTWISKDSCRLYMWRFFDETPGTQTVLVAKRRP